MEDEKQKVIEIIESRDYNRKIPEGMSLGRFINLFQEICEEEQQKRETAQK